MPEHSSYQKGDWLANCDVCGLTFYASQLAKAWDGSMRCLGQAGRGCWETRHPQDFVRGIKDIQSTPWVRKSPVVTSGFVLADFSATAIQFDLRPGLGTLFTSPASGSLTILTLTDALTGLILEIVYAISIVGDHIICQRAQGGTTAVAWKAGDIVTQLGITALGTIQNAVLLEDASYLLLESGSPILLES